MEIKPVKGVQPPKYPLKNEVSTTQIKVAIPRRWAVSQAAKAALGTLAVTALAGCTVAEAVELTVTPRSTGENTASQTTTEVFTEVTAGMPMTPAIPVWPFFIAAAGILAAAILFFRRKGQRKKVTKHTDDDAPGDDY